VPLFLGKLSIEGICRQSVLRTARDLEDQTKNRDRSSVAQHLICELIIAAVFHSVVQFCETMAPTIARVALGDSMSQGGGRAQYLV
jgi:hypothetical protein